MQGFKTLLFNVAMLALASPDVLALVPPKAAIYVITIGNLVLRAITSTPVGKNKEAAVEKILKEEGIDQNLG
jgi:hypothetical protein